MSNFDNDFRNNKNAFRVFDAAADEYLTASILNQYGDVFVEVQPDEPPVCVTEHCAVEQSTWLLDIKNTLIYENDILKDGVSHKYSVIRKGGCYFAHIDGAFLPDIPLTKMWISTYKIEVCGTTHSIRPQDTPNEPIANIKAGKKEFESINTKAELDEFLSQGVSGKTMRLLGVYRADFYPFDDTLTEDEQEFVDLIDGKDDYEEIKTTVGAVASFVELQYSTVYRGTRYYFKNGRDLKRFCELAEGN